MTDVMSRVTPELCAVSAARPPRKKIPLATSGAPLRSRHFVAPLFPALADGPYLQLSGGGPLELRRVGAELGQQHLGKRHDQEPRFVHRARKSDEHA